MRTVTAARSGIAMREDTHFHAARALPLLRRTALEVGRRLADAGILRDAEEVFHLRIAELEALAEPEAIDTAEAAWVHDVVEARAARRAELGGAPLISPTSLFHRTGADADALVTGTPAGGGRATGPVRLVRGPDEFGRLRSGDILVCPYTNPSWTSLFQRAAGVVVDTGGTASHAAIVAREFGIAAVMATGTGTTTLVDGQRVTVDGDTGRVTAAAHP
jgi:pyruvate,water dikinase